MDELTAAQREALVKDLAAYVNVRSPDEFLTGCAHEAVELVDTLTGTAATSVPASVLHRARIEVAAELFHRKQARSGVTTFDGGPESGPEIVRVGNDPLRAVRPILRPYLLGGFS